MPADELKDLDTDWERSKKKYVLPGQGIQGEPPSVSICLLLTIVAVVMTCVMGIVMFFMELDTPRQKLTAIGAVGLFAALTIASIRQLIKSRAYEQARKEYLRQRAEIKARRQPPPLPSDDGTRPAPPLLPFSVIAVFTFARDRMYRVRCHDGKLYFIRVAGQHDAHLVSMPMIDAVDRATLQEAFGKHKHDMVVAVEEVASAAIELPGWMGGGHGKNVGFWRLRLTSGKKWNFQFNDEEEMKRAIATLSAALGDTFRCGAKWDDARQAFVNA